MTRNQILLTAVTAMVLVLTACTAQKSETTAPDNISSTASPASDPTTTVAPTPALTPLPTSDGPVLLIQTDIDSYEIIDFALDLRYPFAPSAGSPRISLGGNLSPGKTRLILPGNSGHVQILDLLSGNVQSIELSQTGFDPDQAAEAALAALAGMKLSIEGAFAAVKSAFDASVSNIGWYQDDNHLMIVTVGSPTSTQVTIKNLLTGEADTVESMPGLVEDYRLNGDWVLVKKGFNFEPGIWQDDHFYLVNLTTRDVKTVELPENIDNPSLSWFDGQSIGIIHQTQPVGGLDYSILDVEIMEVQQVIRGSFSSVQRYQDGLLIFRQDDEPLTTSIQRLDLAGVIQKETVLPERCFLYAVFGEKILINCETESILMDPSLTASSFGDPIFLLSQAPDGSAWILVTRSEEVFMLDSALGNRTPMDLEGALLEVRWLPDSSGFLYRTFGKLFFYDLGNGSSRLLVESDLYNDYANINAGWINLK